MSAVPMATFASRPKAIMNKGEKKMAPPTPEAMATVAMQTDTGVSHQRSNEKSIVFRFSSSTIVDGLSKLPRGKPARHRKEIHV